MKSYGLPYIGSKSRIAKWVVAHLPDAPILVDAFAGGCAITHAAIQSGKFDKVIANDINIEIPKLFFDAVNGKYRNETRWIDRETFHAEKHRDAFIACCWSFGNSLDSYMYSKGIEPYKKAAHYAVVFDDFDQFDELCKEVSTATKKALCGIENTHNRRIAFQHAVVSELMRLTGGNCADPLIQSNVFYRSCKRKRLERLQSLQSLQGLERLQSLQISGLSFEQLDIPAGAVVYCDPPYAGTLKGKKTYKVIQKEFDRTRFFDWCVDVSKTNPVFISEYSIDDPRFVLFAQKVKMCSMCSTKTQKVCERLYTVKT